MILLMLNFLLSIIFLSLSHHPMSMGLTLLMQTILVSLITGMLNMNFWFSYILFLVMIGGMLVLFIYMTSIASNEMFSYSNYTMLFLMIMSFMLTLIYMISDMYLYNYNFLYLDNLYITNMHYNLTKYFNYPSMTMIFFMIIYLFITLIAVVKITKINYGPLRQTF